MVLRYFLLRALWAWLFFLGLGACQSARDEPLPACAGDSDCANGTICHMARCRKGCPEDHWVGEEVKVRATDGLRSATIAQCDDGLWVRYESGIEEQVEARRVKATNRAQAKAQSKK